MLRSLLLVLLAAGPVFAQFDDEDNPYSPGLILTLKDGQDHSATRIAPFLAVHDVSDSRLDHDTPLSVFTGFLRTGAAGEHRFHVRGEGTIELKIAGTVTLKTLERGKWFDTEAIKLPVDYLPIEVGFRGRNFTLCWSCPRFGVEPVPARALFHLKEKSPGNEYERGAALSRTLGCGRCHQGDSIGPRISLGQLGYRMSREWLVDRLSNHNAPPPTPAGQEPASPRRMPSFGLTKDEVNEIANYLLKPAFGEKPPVMPSPPKPKKGQPPVNAKTGEQLFLSLGCLACHTWKDLGASGWYGGGDLTHIADKRPIAFFLEKLDPKKDNSGHRMPAFNLSDAERHSLALFLAEQHTPDAKTDFSRPPLAGFKTKTLIEQKQCAACHTMGIEGPKYDRPQQPQVGKTSAWDQSCLGEPDPAKHRPGYRLEERDAKALRRYFSERNPSHVHQSPDGATLLAESNCMACHARQGPREITPLLPPPLTDKLAAVGKKYPDLAANLGALSPPSLNSVGDKLTDESLKAAIARSGESRRPYLHVRMPKFQLDDTALQDLTTHLVEVDRVPLRGELQKLDAALAERYRVAGSRLVSGDGFGCTSCHRVGEVLPPPGPASARGPDLAMLGTRIRREWYDRWCRDPARIVPRMEMPALQIPVAGVLDDKLDDQIAAVWHVLNLPGFEPPPPAPVRILRHTGQDHNAQAIAITDGLRAGGKMWTKPFLVGLNNRHNVLIDLETASLARWSIGDTARQLTKGKSWLWESGGSTILETSRTSPDLTLVTNGKESAATPRGQFITEADNWLVAKIGAVLNYRLSFDVGTIHVDRTIGIAPVQDKWTGFYEWIAIQSVPAGSTVRIHILSAESAKRSTRSEDGELLALNDGFNSYIRISEPKGAKFSGDGTYVDAAPAPNGSVRISFTYRTETPVDRLPVVPEIKQDLKAVPVEVAPGFLGERLPLTTEIMPTGLAWRPDGKLVFSSLKGQVYEAWDIDNDGREDKLHILCDGLPAPYGVDADDKFAYVATKFGLLRVRTLHSESRGDDAYRVDLVASGWGYTLDYHDWAVGLPRTKAGEYYIGIPCEQDKRSVAGAKHHSEILKLVPRQPTPDDPRLFSLETISKGSRFPMGLALNRKEELFASDNQGNYTPFNEINHVRKGDHFGFINSLDRGKPAPPQVRAAIDIPHPWMRSVNGICFLDTPATAKTKNAFGPFEGHMVGCEFNGKRLVRMTLEKVNGEYQGAVYPLSIPPADAAKGFLGPVVCAVSPKGELYVGGVWDSGWGGGNNVGEIVKVTMQPEKLPAGILEVKAIKDGFVIEFTKPVDRGTAARGSSYSIESYRREPTPAYGGPDLDRRKEKLQSVEVSFDDRKVTLSLAEMRPGHVYEFTLKNLAPNGEEFFPAEAHYTLRSVPK